MTHVQNLIRTEQLNSYRNPRAPIYPERPWANDPEPTDFDRDNWAADHYRDSRKHS